MAGGQISAYFLLFEALFVPVRYGSHRLARRTTMLAIGASVAAGVLALAVGLPGPVLLVLLLVVAMVVSTPLLWSWEVRHHQEARRAAESLTDLERELAASRAGRAVDEERRRIAHDLHDVVAGHLSAISLHTNLAGTLEEDAARERSLETAREAAHAALRDLRSMIGVLATEEDGALPEATLDWPTLTDRLRGRDPAAAVDVDEAVEDPDRVEPSVRAALLRIAAAARDQSGAARRGTDPPPRAHEG